MPKLRGYPLTDLDIRKLVQWLSHFLLNVLVIGEEVRKPFPDRRRKVTLKPCRLIAENQKHHYIALDCSDGKVRNVNIFQVVLLVNGVDVHGEDTARNATKGHNPFSLECSHMGTRGLCVEFQHLNGENKRINLLRRDGCGPNLFDHYDRRLDNLEKYSKVIPLSPMGRYGTCVCRRLCVLPKCQIKVLDTDWGTTVKSDQKCPNLGRGAHKRLHPCFLWYSPEPELWPIPVRKRNESKLSFFSFSFLLPGVFQNSHA